MCIYKKRKTIKINLQPAFSCPWERVKEREREGETYWIKVVKTSRKMNGFI